MTQPFDLPALEAALAAAGSVQERVWALARLGFAVSALGELERGLTLTQEACDLARSVGDGPGLSQAAYYAGASAHRLGRLREALTFMQDALEAAERSEPVVPKLRAQALGGIGLMNQQLGDLPSALSALERSLDAHRAEGNLNAISNTLGYLATVYDDLGDTAHALTLREESVTCARQFGVALPLAESLNNLGFALLTRGHFDRAASALEEALALTQEARNAFLGAYIHSNLAKLQDGLGHPDRALPLRLQALDQSRAVGNQGLEAELLTLLGEAARRRGDLAGARELLDQGLTLAEQVGKKKGVADVHLALAQVFEAQGDTGRALAHYKRFHEVERAVLGEEAERSARLLAARFEAEAARREAELQRLEKVELAQAYGALRRADDDRRALLAQLEYQAHHDNLTGLPNRALFRRRLEEAVHDHQARGASLALLYLDLDGFKPINDTWGHAAGDALLAAVGQRLAECMGGSGMAARLGGDEFAVLAADVNGLEGALQLKGQLTAAIERPISVLGHVVRVGASIGVSLYPRDGEDVEGLLRAADGEMYRVKQDAAQDQEKPLDMG